MLFFFLLRGRPVARGSRPLAFRHTSPPAPPRPIPCCSKKRPRKDMSASQPPPMDVADISEVRARASPVPRVIKFPRSRAPFSPIHRRALPQQYEFKETDKGKV